MQRLLTGTPATISMTLRVDATATDPSPDSATITITRADGTVMVAAAAATNSGTGVFSYALSAAQLATLDELTVQWVSALGTVTDTVEVVGGFHFALSEARALKPMDDAATYSAARLTQARTLAETALEDACMVPFVPRYFRWRLDGNGRCDLMLPRSRPLTVTTATVDGAALTVGDLELYEDGRVYSPNGWASGRRNVIIAGTYGYPFPPPRVARASMLLAKRFIVDSPVNDRATSLTTEDGTTSYLVTAGVRSAITDVPEANAVIEIYGMRDAYTVA
jgi:hypothetical protein